jgi:hypothetical protein
MVIMLIVLAALIVLVGSTVFAMIKLGAYNQMVYSVNIVLVLACGMVLTICGGVIGYQEALNQRYRDCLNTEETRCVEMIFGDQSERSRTPTLDEVDACVRLTGDEAQRACLNAFTRH